MVHPGSELGDIIEHISCNAMRYLSWTHLSFHTREAQERDGARANL